MNNERKSWAESQMRSIIEDRSIVDSKSLEIHTFEEAEAFLKSYGFDLDISCDRQELASINKESIAFIEDVLLDDGEKILPAVRNETDIRRLLIWASRDEEPEKSRWSCALLRVMHTFVHCGSFFTEYFGNQVEDQILGRIQPHIRYTGNQIFIGDIEIANFESRRVKSRQSVALKMLHKIENVSTEIFDWFGIRIVTHDRVDAVRVLEYLIRQNITMLANIKATRSKNTLLDVEQIKKLWNNDGDLDQLKSEMRMIDYPKDTVKRSHNSFSGASYHAIQFTCRHRVRIDEPDGRQARFFFPYEVQILDQESFKKARSGRASHEHYKRRQLKAARARVFGLNQKNSD